jgi:hypothetical protein
MIAEAQLLSIGLCPFSKEVIDVGHDHVVLVQEM